MKQVKPRTEVFLIDFMRSFPDELATLSQRSSSQQQAGPLPPLDLDPSPNGLFAPASPRPSDVSSHPSITVTAPYALPPLRVGPSPHSHKAPSVPTTSSPLSSPHRSKGVNGTNGRIPSPTSSRAKSPVPSTSNPQPNPLLSLGSRLSLIGSNKSSDTVGAGADTLSTSGSVRKKGNRLSRLGDFMRKA